MKTGSASTKLICQPEWQATFLKLLPKIRAQLLRSCLYLPPEDRDETVHEAIALAFRGFLRLMVHGRADRVYPTALARYALCKVRDGRTVGSRRNSCDVLSRFARRRRGFTIAGLQGTDHLPGHAPHPRGWRESLLADPRSSVPDQVAFRIDFPDWLNQLSSRNRRIAESLACGHSTQSVARKYRVSAGRISQLRREFYESWEAFHEGRGVTSTRNVPPNVPEAVGGSVTG